MLIDTVTDGGTIDQVVLDRVKETGRQLRQIIRGLNKLYPKREHLITELALAVLCGRHILIYGESGTAKSSIVRAFMETFEGADYMEHMLSKFTTETEFFGPPHPEFLRDEGLIFRNPDKKVFRVPFFNLDEFLDANIPFLRTLLGPLNEGRYSKGEQEISMGLHSAFATTNWNPYELLEKRQELKATLDRFFFWDKVSSLEDEENQITMWENYALKRKLELTVPFANVLEISNIVRSQNIVPVETNREFLRVFGRIVNGYRDVVKKEHWGIRGIITDRSTCWPLDLLEVEALWHGRLKIIYDDLHVIKYALCTGGETAQFEAFDKIATPIIEEAKQNVGQQTIDQAQQSLLFQIQRQIPTIQPNLSDSQIVNLSRELHQLSIEASQVTSTVTATEILQGKVIDEITVAQEEVERQLLLSQQAQTI